MKKILKNIFSLFFKEKDNEKEIKKLEEYIKKDSDFFGKVINIFLVDKKDLAFNSFIIALDNKGNIIRNTKNKILKELNKKINKFYLRIEKDGFFYKKKFINIK